jgi:hypothetical protein
MSTDKGTRRMAFGILTFHGEKLKLGIFIAPTLVAPVHSKKKNRNYTYFQNRR